MKIEDAACLWMQAAGSNTITSVANIKTQLDLDASRGSSTVAHIAYIWLQLVLDASRQE